MNERPPFRIVVLDDNERWREELLWIVETLPDANRFQVSTFGDDLAAEQFVRGHSAEIAAYIQDMNRDETDLRGLHGVSFFNNVIDALTPNAKTLFHSGVIQAMPGVMRELFKQAPHRIDFVMKGSKDDEYRDSLRWLLKPLEVQVEQEGENSDFIHTLDLIETPWRELRKEIAAAPDLLDTIDSRLFEHLVAEIFRDHGWQVELTARTRDGGYDIIGVQRALPSSMKVLIEAKRYSPGRAVGVGAVRALYGVKTIHAVSQVILATSSFVSGPAKKQFSRVIPWELDFLERDKILSWCSSSEAPQIGGTFG